ncbi:MAG: hypothetical protein GY895_11405 [Phycisphaera sp.]|nr:hypothetical protein [Phycisphaera sp.]
MKTFSRLVFAPALVVISVAAAQAVILDFQEIDTALLAGHPDWSRGDFGSSNGFGFFAREHEANDTIDNFVGTCRGDGNADSGFGDVLVNGQRGVFSLFASWGDVTSMDGSVSWLDLVSATLAPATIFNLEFIPHVGGENGVSHLDLLKTQETLELIVYGDVVEGVFSARLRIGGPGRTVEPGFSGNSSVITSFSTTWRSSWSCRRLRCFRASWGVGRS